MIMVEDAANFWDVAAKGGGKIVLMNAWSNTQNVGNVTDILYVFIVDKDMCSVLITQILLFLRSICNTVFWKQSLANTTLF